MKRGIAQFLLPVVCFVLSFGVLSGTAIAGDTAADAKVPVYKVGVIVPLTGDAASLGNYARKAILLAHEGLPITVREKIQFLFEDDQLKAARTVSAYQKLTSVDKVDAVFVVGSGSGNVLGPLAEKDKRLLVAIGASDKRFAVGTNYVFTHWVSPESETIPLIAEVKKRNFGKIGIISSEQDGANALRDAFLQQLKDQGLGDRIVFDEKVVLEAQDFRALITKARSKNVDGLCTIILPGSLALFAKQARELQFPGDIFGYELFEDSNEVKASEGALVGKWYVNASDPTNDFVTKFKAKYNEHPGFAAGNAYDVASLVSFAASAYNGDNAKIADHLREIKDYHGAIGIYSATGDNRFALPASLKVVLEDGFKKLQ